MTHNNLFVRPAIYRASVRLSLLFFILVCTGTSLFAQYKSDTKEEKERLGALATSYYKKLSKEGPSPAPENVTAINSRFINGQGASDHFGKSVSTAGDVNGDGFADVIVGANGYSTNTGRAYIYYGGPSMDNIADVTMTGEATYDYFGTSVSTAGDVNGDGYADVIVGAQGYSTNTGRAYIYYGGPSMDNIADVTMNGEATNNYFGHSVSSAGDVNGDGYADVIVGAYGYSSGTGRVYIYYGGSGMNNTADVTMNGDATNDNFGNAVSSAGDVNGDGYADVIVGAWAYSSFRGRIYIYYGGSSMNNTEDVTMTGETTSNSFGISVSTAGDVNGDGYADVIVGAYGYSTGTGRAYIYYGGPSMNNTADKTVTGETNSSFGISVSTAGDVNGDGYTDVIVGASDYNSSTGRVYLYQNSLMGTDIPDEKFTGEASINTFGYSVSTAGDVNGDGYADVIVGASGYSSNTGRAYIYYGGPGMDNTADVTMTGEAVSNYFGSFVSTAGDVNGDGYADVIVGAPGYSTSTGRAYIYYGGSSMNNTADVIMTGGITNDNFGALVSTAGDVNGDGYADVIVGAPQYSTSTGRAYIYYGASSMNNTADVIMTGEATYNQFGGSVSTAGDVNGDGYADVIVGAYNNFSNRGRAYIYYGGSSMDNTADVIMTGEAIADYFGFSVSGAGDVNGDGYADVIVGAYGYSSITGRAYIYYGGQSMDNFADVIMIGRATNNYFGYSVSGAGDVNGDGYADVIVGAYCWYNGTGQAYIYYGGSSMDNTVDVAMTGETITDFFGVSVSSAGDVNGDGYADVIVGAENYSSGTGRAYLYRSSSPPIVPRIASVADVPHDQGGVVDVRWIRSGYDARNVSRVTSYRLERSNPSGTTGFAWTTVATISASHNPQYNYPALTPYDSMTGTSGNFFFRITAVTANNEEYWRSNIVSGHSVDNIPPVAPSGGAIAAQANGNIIISWNQNRTDGDVGGFTVYRSTTTGFTPMQANAISTTRDTSYLDNTSAAGEHYYYRIKAVDIHGNESAPSSELSTTALSVELVSFTATSKRLNAELKWKTATEINNYGFEIERRTTPVSPPLQGGDERGGWTKAGFVEGSGTSNTPKEYSFMDKNIAAGKYSYRLKQIDRDGKFEYSQSVEVTVGQALKEFALAQNYPNPFNPTTNIEFTVPSNGRATLKIFTAIGQEVATLFDGEAEAGKYYQMQFNANGLATGLSSKGGYASGVYFSRLQFGDKIQLKKMMFLK